MLYQEFLNDKQFTQAIKKLLNALTGRPQATSKVWDKLTGYEQVVVLSELAPNTPFTDFITRGYVVTGTNKNGASTASLTLEGMKYREEYLALTP